MNESKHIYIVKALASQIQAERMSKGTCVTKDILCEAQKSNLKKSHEDLSSLKYTLFALLKVLALHYETISAPAPNKKKD